jgi:hypothetical protein
MSNILIFRPVSGQTRTQPPPDLGEAAILFFTGVRYERQAEQAETRSLLAMSSRKTAAVGKRIQRKKPVAKQAKPAAKTVKTLKPVAKSTRPRKARA